MADHMRTKLVQDALTMALWRRRPATGLLRHSDRDSQYAGKDHRTLPAANGIECSMSRKGNCCDNGVMKRFF